MRPREVQAPPRPLRNGERLRLFLRHRRGLVFAVPAGALAILLIVAAMNLDQGTTPRKQSSRLSDAPSLLAPQFASAEELRNAGGSLSDQTAIKLADGAWVQVADETGRLAQQYSAGRLEPLGGQKLQMSEPRARFYLRDGRVLTLVARDGVVSVPHRALESGVLEGDVEIRLFKPSENRQVDVLLDRPSMTINADTAQFDGIAGEVRCDRAVRIETDAGSFAGEGLTLVLDSDGAGVERLLVDRALEPIRIDRSARALAAKRRAAASNAAATPDDLLINPVQPLVPDSTATDGGASANHELQTTPQTTADEPDLSPSNIAPSAAPPVIVTPKPAAAEPTRFYRLVLTGGVLVVRTRGGVVSTIRGDELIAIFSLESQGLDALAFTPVGVGAPSSSWLSTLAPTPASVVSALAFALPQDAPTSNPNTDDSVTVSFGGRLEMVPVVDAADALKTRDDIRFDVLGSRVELHDGKSHTQVTCSRLRYSVLDERVDAEGSEHGPLVVANARLRMEASRFWASFSTGVGRLDGPGRMALARGAAGDVAWLQIAPSITPDAARLLVSSDPAAVALVLDPPQPAPTTPRFDATHQEIEITWKGGVDLQFTGGADDSRISHARFEGGVDVFGKQFELASQTLEVGFNAVERERVDSIIADGGTTVRQLGAAGSMQAQRLELALGVTEKGDAIPRKLVARGAVEAKDARQTIWTEDLLVTFAEKREAAAPTTDPAIDVAAVEATGGVQVLLGEGARVFADSLTGNALERKLRLIGEKDSVAIVRSNIIADNLRDLRFDDATHAARSEGPGRFRAYREPITVGSGRIDRPDPTVATSLDASWTEGLEYQEASADDGTIDIRGDVQLRSRPSALATDAVDAKSVILGHGPDPSAGKAAAKASDGSTKANADTPRALKHFLARGDARIESRLWPDAAHTGEPRVFRVTGEHIEYDMISREGLVVGVGALLVNIPLLSDEAKRPVRSDTAIALGAEGTTRFNWTQRMALEHIVDDRFLVRMHDGVELLHAGVRDADRFSMRCDALEATVRRSDETKSRTKDGPGVGTAATAGVDLGGPADLLGVKGVGRVFIRTPAQDVECEEFEYSVRTGIATLKAAPGRAVTVVFANTPTPLSAQEIEWDLHEGRLEIRKPLVVGGR